MGKTTDQLIAMAREVSPTPRGREMDLLLASGEQIAVSMLGLALQARGVAAVSLTATQCGIHTDGSFNRARVRGGRDRSPGPGTRAPAASSSSPASRA